jgi:hypothetical protein
VSIDTVWWLQQGMHGISAHDRQHRGQASYLRSPLAYTTRPRRSSGTASGELLLCCHAERCMTYRPQELAPPGSPWLLTPPLTACSCQRWRPPNAGFARSILRAWFAHREQPQRCSRAKLPARSICHQPAPVFWLHAAGCGTRIQLTAARPSGLWTHGDHRTTPTHGPARRCWARSVQAALLNSKAVITMTTISLDRPVVYIPGMHPLI